MGLGWSGPGLHVQGKSRCYFDANLQACVETFANCNLQTSTPRISQTKMHVVMTLIHFFVCNQHVACKLQKNSWFPCLPLARPYAIPELNPILRSNRIFVIMIVIVVVVVITSLFHSLDLDLVFPFRT
jgi:hypothetical protein